MADKHFVVKGAICICNFAPAPDTLEVLTNQTEYANDIDGAQKFSVPRTNFCLNNRNSMLRKR